VNPPSGTSGSISITTLSGNNVLGFTANAATVASSASPKFLNMTSLTTSSTAL
jgi:hypothetical protein